MRKAQSGIAMLQVILAFAMLAGLSVFILKSNQNSMKVQQTTEVSADKEYLIKRLSTFFETKETCLANLVGVDFSSGPSTITELRYNAAGSGVIKANEKITGTDLNLNEIKIIPPPIAELDNYGYGKIEAKLSFSQNAGLGAQVFTQSYFIKGRFCKSETRTTAANTLTKSRAYYNLFAQCQAAHAGFIEIDERSIVYVSPGVFRGICLFECGPGSDFRLYSCGS